MKHELPFPAPNDRVKCRGCQKPMPVKKDGHYLGLKFIPDGFWSYGGYTHFCSMTCATAFANKKINKPAP